MKGPKLSLSCCHSESRPPELNTPQMLALLIFPQARTTHCSNTCELRFEDCANYLGGEGGGSYFSNELKCVTQYVS